MAIVAGKALVRRALRSLRPVARDTRSTADASRSVGRGQRPPLGRAIFAALPVAKGESDAVLSFWKIFRCALTV